jgi:hypothetical protein
MLQFSFLDGFLSKVTKAVQVQQLRQFSMSFDPAIDVFCNQNRDRYFAAVVAEGSGMGSEGRLGMGSEGTEEGGSSSNSKAIASTSSTQRNLSALLKAFEGVAAEYGWRRDWGGSRNKDSKDSTNSKSTNSKSSPSSKNSPSSRTTPNNTHKTTNYRYQSRFHASLAWTLEEPDVVKARGKEGNPHHNFGPNCWPQALGRLDDGNSGTINRTIFVSHVTVKIGNRVYEIPLLPAG